MQDKVRELLDEFRAVMSGGGGVADSILPPLVFVVLNALLGLTVARWGALVLAGLIAGLRLARGQSLRYALGGLGGIAIALLITRLLGRAEGYFLPGIVSGIGAIILAVASLLVRRPMVAWTSYIARRWPLDWYWHPRVRPAYNEVTAMWIGYYALRSSVQWTVIQSGAIEWVALVNFFTGWLGTVTLLVLSYLYGTWRLQRLRGPSVQEFSQGAQPPWVGQRRGF